MVVFDVAFSPVWVSASARNLLMVGIRVCEKVARIKESSIAIVYGINHIQDMH